MKKALLLLFSSFSFIAQIYSQHSINYMSTTAGARVGDGTSNVNYFGPNDYGDMGSCSSGNWRWIHALCSATGNENNLNSSTKTNIHSGSTWSAGGGASRYMVIDLGQARTFNELRVFQMHPSSDGKVTSIRMYSHSDLTTLPIYSDTGWSPLFAEQTVQAGTVTGNTVSNPTVITFSDASSRYLLIEAKNNGSLGNGAYTEIRELRLFRNSSLPVELTHFSAKYVSEKVQLRWETASEIENDFFSIERSLNGMDWHTINVVKGKGTTSSSQVYTYYDNSPYNGKSYYRLKQTDFNGMFTFSKIRDIQIGRHDELNNQIGIFPNPAIDKTNIVGNVSKFKNVKIFNITGEELTNEISLNQKNNQSIELDLSKLPRGVYFLETKSSMHKLIKQ